MQSKAFWREGDCKTKAKTEAVVYPEGAEVESRISLLVVFSISVSFFLALSNS